jgi:ATP-dependent DNA helicase DinG
MEAAELRRWLLGAEGGRSRARGLRRRVEDLVAARDDLIAPLDAALMAARALPAPGWPERLGLELPSIDGEQANPTEAFLRAARQQALARVQGDGEAIGAIECDLYPVGPELPERAAGLARALQRLATPLKTLMDRMAARLEDEAEELDEATRTRIEAACRSLKRRAVDPLGAWGAMLAAVGAVPPEPGERPEHVMFLRLDRRGTEADDAPLGFRMERVGLARHVFPPAALKDGARECDGGDAEDGGEGIVARQTHRDHHGGQPDPFGESAAIREIGRAHV